VVRLTLAVAAGSILLTGGAMLARASRPDPQVGGLRRMPPLNSGSTDGSAEEAPVDEVATASLEARVTEFVFDLKAAGLDDASPSSVETSLGELLQRFPLHEVLNQLGRHAALEEGFSVLRRLVAEGASLRASVLEVIRAGEVDPETRLFALRLLPPFSALSSLERAALLNQEEQQFQGELGRQVVRHVGKDPAEEGVSLWLSRRLNRCPDPEVQAEVLRALVRSTDPMALSILKQCFDTSDGPVADRATILAALSAAGPAAYARHPWLPGALEDCIRLRPGEALTSDRQKLAFHAVTILGQSVEVQKLSCLLESEKTTSDPEGRALIAFSLRWLPAPEAAATLSSMASNPGESPRVRLTALESLRGKKTDAVVRRLLPMTSESGVPPDVKAALDRFLGE
jgi:hypothetical protein